MRRCAAGPALALALALLAILPAVPARAGVRFEADNDYFDFWIPRDRRPDHDYSQGFRISVVQGAPPRWFPAFLRRETPCAEPPDGGPCSLASFEVGQEIYTPTYDAPEPVPGQRPYAARLFVGASAHRVGDGLTRTVSLRLGVTGPPALGEAAQLTLHRLRGFQEPRGWGHQVPFEPTLEIAMAEERTALALSSGNVRLLEIVPRGRGILGNWHTGGDIGLSGRAGYGLPGVGRDPRAEGGRVSAYAMGSLREDWVLHDLTLDGSTFGDSPRVSKRPFVFQGEVGGGLRFGPVRVEYRAVYRGREYDGGPDSHRWGSLWLFIGRAAPDAS